MISGNSAFLTHTVIVSIIWYGNIIQLFLFSVL